MKWTPFFRQGFKVDSKDRKEIQKGLVRVVLVSRRRSRLPNIIAEWQKQLLDGGGSVLERGTPK